MGKKKEKMTAQSMECSQCGATAVGLPSHVGKSHQACFNVDKHFLGNDDDGNAQYKETRTPVRMKGDGSPRDGVGKWVSA